jgi:uncharacterized membrane-anchored protein
MTPIANLFRRIPPVVPFALAGLIQIALIALMVVDRMGILREGTEVLLLTRPVDPRDFLRGDYVRLAYEMSSMDAGELKGQSSAGKGAAVFVKLAPKADGYYEAVSIHQDAVDVAGGEVLIRGHVTNGTYCGADRHSYCDRLQINYGLERYFVPEGEGREIESARNQGKVAVVAAVTGAGRAAIKRLIVDGKPVYDEPLF